jgi:hypothetical protein
MCGCWANSMCTATPASQRGRGHRRRRSCTRFFRPCRASPRQRPPEKARPSSSSSPVAASTCIAGDGDVDADDGPLPSELIEMLPAVPSSAVREEEEDQVSVAAYWSNKKNLANDDKQRDKPKNTYALISYNLIRI